MCYRPMLAERKNDVIKMLKYATEQDIARVACSGSKYELILPCGQCIECRLKHSKEWAMRCMLEAKQYRHNEFLTLTYDSENLPVSADTGIPSLNPDDLTKFNKDLRDHWRYHHNGHQGIRFYACGEYGSNTKRPHFHGIYFNLPVLDKEKYKKTAAGWLYTSEEIADIWGKGFVTLANVTFDTAAYVARYIMKKQLGEGAEIYHQQEIIPEFTRMSRMPGIGGNYYQQNKDKIYESDEIYLDKNGKPYKCKPAKYFDRLYDEENPERLKALKEARKTVAENALSITLSQTDLNFHEYLEVKKGNKKAQIEKLIRPL